MAAATALVLSGCGGDTSSSSAPTPPIATEGPASTARQAAGSTPPPGSPSTPTGGASTGERCRVRLHGKGEQGGETEVDGDDVRNVFPDGNAEGWGARQWLYFPDDEYDAAVAVVREAVDGCDVILLGGFSNGAAFAAKLYCRGETFDGRLAGIVIDDPVPDHAADGCQPDPAVVGTLYWTGALADQATPGWSCADADWTCEGGETIGIDDFAAHLDLEVRASPMDGHASFSDAPELSAWP